jgi:hypothetical protein
MDDYRMASGVFTGFFIVLVLSFCSNDIDIRFI